jgi:hypothetical protein
MTAALFFLIFLVNLIFGPSYYGTGACRKSSPKPFSSVHFQVSRKYDEAVEAADAPQSIDWTTTQGDYGNSQREKKTQSAKGRTRHFKYLGELEQDLDMNHWKTTTDSIGGHASRYGK